MFLYNDNGKLTLTSEEKENNGELCKLVFITGEDEDEDEDY